MLNTRHKLAPFAPAATATRRKSLRTSNYRRNRFSYVGRIFPGRLVAASHNAAAQAWQFSNRELISAPVSSDFTRARMRALKRRSLPSISLAPFICGDRRREVYVVRRACFERPPVPHARIFGRFHPVTPNVLKIPTEYDGKIPFIALIHFVGRRRDFGVTRKFRAVA